MIDFVSYNKHCWFSLDNVLIWIFKYLFLIEEFDVKHIQGNISWKICCELLRNLLWLDGNSELFKFRALSLWESYLYKHLPLQSERLYLSTYGIMIFFTHILQIIVYLVDFSLVIIAYITQINEKMLQILAVLVYKVEKFDYITILDH